MDIELALIRLETGCMRIHAGLKERPQTGRCYAQGARLGNGETKRSLGCPFAAPAWILHRFKTSSNL